MKKKKKGRKKAKMAEHSGQTDSILHSEYTTIMSSAHLDEEDGGEIMSLIAPKAWAPEQSAVNSCLAEESLHLLCENTDLQLVGLLSN